MKTFGKMGLWLVSNVLNKMKKTSLRSFSIDNVMCIVYNDKMTMDELKVFGLKKLNRGALKKAYKKLSKQYHPDNNETGDKNKFVLINNLYNKLLSETIKETYIIKINLNDLINGKTYTLFDNVSIHINYKMIKKPFIFKYMGEKYKIIVKPLLDKNQKLVYSKGKLKLITTLKG